MIVILITAIFLLVLIISLKLKMVNPGVPMLPGAWPIVGHIPLLLGDNIKLFKTLDKVSKAANLNGGCICISLGLINYYVFTDPDDSYAIMNSSVEKHYSYNFTKPYLGDGLLTAEPHKWYVNKKLLYPMFQPQNLNKFLTVFNKQGRRLVEQFSEHVGKGDFDHETNTYCISIDTMCRTTMGSNVGQNETASYKTFLEAIDIAINCTVKRFSRVWLHLEPVFEASTTKRELNKNADIVIEFTKNLLQQRKSQLKPKSKVEASDTEGFAPFIDTLIRTSQNNKHFHDKQVIDEVNTLIIAGYDTTANALMYALMLLGHYQDVQDKVYKELYEIFGDTDRDLDKYDLKKLVYLEAFLKEVLRLYASVPFVARNVHTNLKLKNCTIPAGTSCFVSLYGLHRNPEWGVDAELFNPERWMNPETIPKNPYLFAPFGMGKRYCAGKTFAMMSLKTTLSYVVRNYRIQANMNNLLRKMMILSKPASGHHISLEYRN